MVGTVPVHAARAGARRRGDAARRPLLARRDALRAGHRAPPFLGDTPTAVISQHLNTPPVAPSWHTEHCPPALEDADPAPARQGPRASGPPRPPRCCAALERVDPEAALAPRTPDSSANPLDRLARGVFVGRERELEQLRDAFDGAFQGRGSVVMLVGEPGIGKTRTVAGARDLRAHARRRGATGAARTSRRACRAYWPWVQVGRAWGRQDHDVAPRGCSSSRLRLGELRAALPGAARQLPDLPAPAEQPTPTSRAVPALRRLRAVRARGVERRAPLVIVLDDLHWADKPTLQLLQYLARELGGHARARHRHLPRHRARAHAPALRGARRAEPRGPASSACVLRGLSRDEVRRLHPPAASVEPRRGADRPHLRGDRGQPVLPRRGREPDGAGGHARAGAPRADIALPDGVREALGRRLDRLSEEANALLRSPPSSAASSPTRRSTCSSSTSDDELLRLIEEALAARVIEEAGRPGRYRFTHALMQETLLDELSTTRRVRLHGQVAEALERRCGDRADEYATSLALHYAESATLTPQHVVKAVHYLVRAARDRRSALRVGRGARLYTLATGLLQRDEVESDEDVAAIFAALGRAAANVMDYRPAWRALMTALDRYRERKDWVAFADIACFIFLGWAPAVQDYGRCSWRRPTVVARQRGAAAAARQGRKRPARPVAGCGSRRPAGPAGNGAGGRGGDRGPAAGGTGVRLGGVAQVQRGAASRRGGGDACGGRRPLRAGWRAPAIACLSATPWPRPCSPAVTSTGRQPAYQARLTMAVSGTCRLLGDSAAGSIAAIHILRGEYDACEALCEQYRDAATYQFPLRRGRYVMLRTAAVRSAAGLLNFSLNAGTKL